MPRLFPRGVASPARCRTLPFALGVAAGLATFVVPQARAFDLDGFLDNTSKKLRETIERKVDETLGGADESGAPPAAGSQPDPAGAPEPARPAAAPSGQPVEAAQPSAPTRAQVRETQRRLNALGYPAGPVDGVMGRQTRAAIRAWQRDRGRPAADAVTPALLAELRRASQDRHAVATATGGDAARSGSAAAADPWTTGGSRGETAARAGAAASGGGALFGTAGPATRSAMPTSYPDAYGKVVRLDDLPATAVVLFGYRPETRTIGFPKTDPHHRTIRDYVQRLNRMPKPMTARQLGDLTAAPRHARHIRAASAAFLRANRDRVNPIASRAAWFDGRTWVRILPPEGHAAPLTVGDGTTAWTLPAMSPEAVTLGMLAAVADPLPAPLVLRFAGVIDPCGARRALGDEFRRGDYIDKLRPKVRATIDRAELVGHRYVQTLDGQLGEYADGAFPLELRQHMVKRSGLAHTPYGQDTATRQRVQRTIQRDCPELARAPLPPVAVNPRVTTSNLGNMRSEVALPRPVAREVARAFPMHNGRAHRAVTVALVREITAVEAQRAQSQAPRVRVTEVLRGYEIRYRHTGRLIAAGAIAESQAATAATAALPLREPAALAAILDNLEAPARFAASLAARSPDAPRLERPIRVSVKQRADRETGRVAPFADGSSQAFEIPQLGAPRAHVARIGHVRLDDTTIAETALLLPAPAASYAVDVSDASRRYLRAQLTFTVHGATMFTKGGGRTLLLIAANPTRLEIYPRQREQPPLHAADLAPRPWPRFDAVPTLPPLWVALQGATAAGEDPLTAFYAATGAFARQHSAFDRRAWAERSVAAARKQEPPDDVWLFGEVRLTDYDFERNAFDANRSPSVLHLGRRTLPGMGRGLHRLLQRGLAARVAFSGLEETLFDLPLPPAEAKAFRAQQTDFPNVAVRVKLSRAGEGGGYAPVRVEYLKPNENVFAAGPHVVLARKAVEPPDRGRHGPATAAANAAPGYAILGVELGDTLRDAVAAVKTAYGGARVFRRSYATTPSWRRTLEAWDPLNNVVLVASETGADAVAVYHDGAPDAGDGRVIAVARTLRFADGHQPFSKSIAKKLAETYGPYDATRGRHELRWPTAAAMTARFDRRDPRVRCLRRTQGLIARQLARREGLARQRQYQLRTSDGDTLAAALPPDMTPQGFKLMEGADVAPLPPEPPSPADLHTRLDCDTPMLLATKAVTQAENVEALHLLLMNPGHVRTVVDGARKAFEAERMADSKEQVTDSIKF